LSLCPLGRGSDADDGSTINETNHKQLRRGPGTSRSNSSSTLRHDSKSARRPNSTIGHQNSGNRQCTTRCWRSEQQMPAAVGTNHQQCGSSTSADRSSRSLIRRVYMGRSGRSQACPPTPHS